MGLVGVFLLFFILMNVKYSVYTFSGRSMWPTIQDKQKLKIDKLSEPHRGDIVIFTAPKAANCPESVGCQFAKRVIAGPGDTVRIQNNTVIVNNKPLDEPYLAQNMQTAAGQWFGNEKELQLESKEYFLLGDNRPQSADSRSYGPVTRDLIIGVAKL